MERALMEPLDSTAAVRLDTMEIDVEQVQFLIDYPAN